MIRHALIMAAGRGQRMVPVTDTIPKPMAPYNGTTLIARGIAQLSKRIEQIHVTVGYKKAMLAQHVIEQGAMSVFNTEGHGNGWWVYNTPLQHLDEPAYVLTCDNVMDLDFDLLAESYEALARPACLLIPARPVEGIEGDYIFRRGATVTDISREEVSDIYCSGIQILNPRRVNELTQRCEDFNDIWRQLIARGQLLVSPVYPRRWFAVDTVEQLRALWCQEVF
jgi:NDP-sugar pyrophosphorylase family protein